MPVVNRDWITGRKFIIVSKMSHYINKSQSYKDWFQLIYASIPEFDKKKCNAIGINIISTIASTVSIALAPMCLIICKWHQMYGRKNRNVISPLKHIYSAIEQNVRGHTKKNRNASHPAGLFKFITQRMALVTNLNLNGYLLT